MVKSTNAYDIKVQPKETLTLSGLVRKNRQVEAVITEQTEGASTRIGVCPRIVSLQKIGTSQRVPVRIYNMSAKVLHIKPNSDLCELHDVKVLRHIDPVSSDIKKAQINQQSTSVKDKEVLPEGINLGDASVSEEEKSQLSQFLGKWKHIFSTSFTDLGNCDLVKHKINLTDDQPIKEPPRRIPPALYTEVKEHLVEMIEAGAVRPSHSPYSSNIVLARKKDGSLRFCVDFRKLNNKTVKDAYAIPRIEESLHLLAGAKYFSKLDLRSGYWQVEIEEEDKEKTAFQMGGLGFYEFNRMPFGLCNAPATFQRLMERCMGDLNLRDCLIYLDDIVIFSSTFQEHLEHLEAVFSRLAEHNLKLKASKCEFLKSEVTYLGHVVSEEGIQTDPEKLEAIRTWPVPQNVKEVRSFLGFTGYYRRFIKNYASIARPLNDLLVGHCTNKTEKTKSNKVKKAPFDWNDDQQLSFETLKEKLMSPPILAYADYNVPFKLHTDASGTGLGAVLYQEQDGKERVIAFASRSLKPSEKNYPAHKLEFLALKWAVTEKYHDYLYGATFEVITDNNPLTYVFTTAKLDATGQRWLAALSNYNCTIKYRSGKNNADADGLSRLHDNEKNCQATVFPEVLKAMSQSIVVQAHNFPLVESLPACSLDDIDTYPDNIPKEALEGTALTIQDWKKAQADDKNIAYIVQCLSAKSKPSRQEIDSKNIDNRYKAEWERYRLKCGILYRTYQVEDEEFHQLVLPESLRDIIFKSYHDDLGHQGRDRTLSLIKQRFYWPGMTQYVQSKVQHCVKCIRRKTRPTKAAELVNITSSTPMELVCIDYLSLERSKGGYENILVITDHFSRYAQAIPTRNQTARTTARVLYENFFVHYGFPAKLHSDKGANFESKVIKKLCEITKIKKTRTTPYHPMGNGMVERFNKTLLGMLGTMTDKQKLNWKEHVSTLTQAYNATVHESIGYSPFYLMYGRHPRLAIDAFLGLLDSEPVRKSHQNYAEQLKARMAEAYKEAGKQAARKGRKYKQYYDEKVRYAVLEPGDRVLVRKVGIQGKHKLADLWEADPYIIRSQPIPDVPVFRVEKENSPGKFKLLHRNMLLPFHGLPSPFFEPSSPRKPTKPAPKDSVVENTDTSSSCSDTESSASEESASSTIPRYVIPQKRGQPARRIHQEKKESQNPPRRRPQRVRRPPNWMRGGDWDLRCKQHTFKVDPKDVVYL